LRIAVENRPDDVLEEGRTGAPSTILFLSFHLYDIMQHEMEDFMPAIKTVGRSGQISLGKEFAGQHVLIDEIEPGVWMLKIGRFIPENEAWLHQEPAISELDDAIAWDEANPPTEADLFILEEKAGT
jgi:hypothetical protein